MGALTDPKLFVSVAVPSLFTGQALIQLSPLPLQVNPISGDGQHQDGWAGFLSQPGQ